MPLKDINTDRLLAGQGWVAGYVLQVDTQGRMVWAAPPASSTAIPEAPVDGQFYVRGNLTWEPGIKAADAWKSAPTDVLHPTGPEPAGIEENRVYSVGSSGMVHASYVGIAGRYLVNTTLITKKNGIWIVVGESSGFAYVGDLRSFVPPVVKYGGDMYKHQGGPGTLDGVNWGSESGNKITHGDVLVYSAQDNDFQNLSSLSPFAFTGRYTDTIDITVAAPTPPVWNKIFLVQTAGVAHSTFTDFRERWFNQNEHVYYDGVHWVSVDGGVNVLRDDFDAVTNGPIVPPSNGDIYIHTDGTGTLVNPAWNNLVGEQVNYGTMLMYLGESNRWLKLTGSEVRKEAPTADEIHRIGAGLDYEDILEFLEDNRTRPKNEFTITGEVDPGHIVGYEIDVHGGDYAQIHVTSNGAAITNNVVGTPVKFQNCPEAPTLSIHFSFAAAPANPVFNYIDSVAHIGSLRTSGVPVPKALYFEQSIIAIDSASVFTACTDTMWEQLGGETVCNGDITYGGDCRAIDVRAGGQISSDASPYLIAKSGAGNSTNAAVVNVAKGCSVTGIGLTLDNITQTAINCTGHIEGTITSASANNVLKLDRGASATLDIDIVTVTGNTSELSNGAWAYLTMVSTGNDGGSHLVRNSTLIIDKADDIDYDDLSTVNVEVLQTIPDTAGLPDSKGLLLHGNVAGMDLLRSATNSIIDISSAPPVTVRRNVVYLVTVAGTADAGYPGLAGKFVPTNALVRFDGTNWFMLTAGARVVSGDHNLVTTGPVSPLSNGDIYIHRGATGNLANAGWLNLVGTEVQDGTTIIFSDEDNKWAILGGTDSATPLTPPTANETKTIGAGLDYEDINAFLLSQAHRPKNNFTVTGNVDAAHVIDYEVHHYNGDFTNVIVSSLPTAIAVTLDHTPFLFHNVIRAPRLDLALDFQALIAVQDAFVYYHTSADIGEVHITSTGGIAPRYIWNFDNVDADFTSPDSEIHACSNTIIFSENSTLHLNHVEYHVDCIVLNASMSTLAPLVSGVNAIFDQATVTNPSTTLTRVHRGSTVTGVTLRGTGLSHTGTAWDVDASSVYDIEAEYNDLNIGVGANNAKVYATIDASSFTASSAVITGGSLVHLTLTDPVYKGGQLYVRGSVVWANKADTLDYDDGATIYINELENQLPNMAVPSELGVVYVGTGARDIHPPTADETHTIGPATTDDYPNIKAFLDDQQFRRKNTFTVTGTVDGSHAIDYLVNYTGGDFTNVTLNNALADTIVCSTTTSPFTFENCVAAPQVALTLNMTSLNTGQSIMVLRNSPGNIAALTLTSTSGNLPRSVWSIDEGEYALVPGSVISAVEDRVLDIWSADVEMGDFSIGSNASLALIRSGGALRTTYTNGPGVATWTVSTNKALITVETGGIAEGIEVKTTGQTASGTAWVVDGGTVRDCRADGTTIDKALTATNGARVDLAIDAVGFGAEAVSVESDSRVNYTMTNNANTGGALRVRNAFVRANKATSLDYDDFSIVQLDTLDTVPFEVGSISDKGIVTLPEPLGPKSDLYYYNPDVASGALSHEWRRIAETSGGTWGNICGIFTVDSKESSDLSQIMFSIAASVGTASSSVNPTITVLSASNFATGITGIRVINLSGAVSNGHMAVEVRVQCDGSSPTFVSARISNMTADSNMEMKKFEVTPDVPTTGAVVAEITDLQTKSFQAGSLAKFDRVETSSFVADAVDTITPVAAISAPDGKHSHYFMAKVGTASPATNMVGIIVSAGQDDPPVGPQLCQLQIAQNGQAQLSGVNGIYAAPTAATHIVVKKYVDDNYTHIRMATRSVSAVVHPTFDYTPDLADDGEFKKIIVELDVVDDVTGDENNYRIGFLNKNNAIKHLYTDVLDEEHSHVNAAWLYMNVVVEDGKVRLKVTTAHSTGTLTCTHTLIQTR